MHCRKSGRNGIDGSDSSATDNGEDLTDSDMQMSSMSDLEEDVVDALTDMK